MKPKKKGWLKDYLEFRKDLLQDLAEDSRKAAHPEQSLYKMIQPTGIMYGQSVNLFDHPDAKIWSARDRMKILLAESLISSALFYQNTSLKNPEDLSDVMTKAMENISGFYTNVFPEFSISSHTFFGKKRTSIELAEKILSKRIDLSQETSGNFWSQFFHNSLLFLDIFIFGQWIHTKADKIVSDFFKYEKEELRFSVIKVITAAAHANHKIEFEEKRLLEYFIQGSGLSPERKMEANAIFEAGIEIEEISLPTNNSWILKKYFLEIAILTMWADKQVEEKELSFLQRLNHHFGFSHEDLENSLIAIEGFVLEHWDQLNYFQNKQSYEQVSDHFIKRLSKITNQNNDRLVKEVRNNIELVKLLRKGRSKELTDAEKEQVQKLLITILKTVPTFVIISLPQRFLTLPILMKILPGNFFTESLDD